MFIAIHLVLIHRSEKEAQTQVREEPPQPVDPREHFPTSRGLVTSRARKHF